MLCIVFSQLKLFRFLYILIFHFLTALLLIPETPTHMFHFQVSEPRIPVHEVSPSAPSSETPSGALSLFSNQMSVTARGLNSECAICLDKEVGVLNLVRLLHLFCVIRIQAWFGYLLKSICLHGLDILGNINKIKKIT